MAIPALSGPGSTGHVEPVAPPRGGPGGGQGWPAKRTPSTLKVAKAGLVVPGAPAGESRLAARRHRQVLRQFRVLLAAVREHFHSVDARVGLGTVQAWALRIIDAHPGIGVARLAVALDVCQPTASNLVKSLCDRGLIERRRGTADRRVVQLFTLDEGRSALSRARCVFSGPLASAIASLEAKTLRELGDDLRQLLAGMQAGSAAHRHRRSTASDSAP